MVIFPWAVYSPAITGSTTPRAARRVNLDVVCPWPPLWATPCQVTPHYLGRHSCVVWPSVAAVSHATARALSAPGVERAVPCVRCVQTWVAFCGLASIGCGPHCSGQFGTVAGPRQAKRALCAWSELGFGPVAI
jgi:hypothetical protein